ncbi:hypothetical protein [Planomonospora venezuelensis]|uniref:Secreted protein n=1 Tax=Planomonospora venezuelensis TaxID=1999 RepID=A0A841CVV3_PLAVE|nr:hypothetical protein [Planomonospora venezuelensis]MBB5960963.1 hypothetical protein [Planomonospora venezuelensis]GIN01197.1 hypothetical protein Pve01_28550 [Planomonospora venezuelensis]
MSRFSKTGKRIATVLFGAVAAALISATAAAPAHAMPPWWSYQDEYGDAGLYQVHYEDGRPYTVELCWSYEGGQYPCGRYF